MESSTPFPAFCNAGFDLMGKDAPYASFTGYYDDPLVNIVIMALIIIGGIGFFVWNDVSAHRYHISLIPSPYQDRAGDNGNPGNRRGGASISV